MGPFLPGLEAWSDVKIAALTLVVSLAVLIRIATGKGGLFGSPRARRYRGSFRPKSYRADYEFNRDYFGPQLEAVMLSPFQKRRILNASEYRAFRLIESDIAAARKGYRVFAQTCLGEILQSSSEEAFRSINSKRVDILIVDQGGWPVLAVEYQGEGHHQGNAAARDAIKKEALRKAGVRYMEILPADSDAQILSHMREYLGWAGSAPMRQDYAGQASAHEMHPASF